MRIYSPMCVFRYPQKREVVKEVHNSVIYKASDVVYDLKHTACSSAESPRLRLIQVQSYVWRCMHTHVTSTFTMHPWYIVHTNHPPPSFVPPHTPQESAGLSINFQNYLKRRKRDGERQTNSQVAVYTPTTCTHMNNV